MEDDTREKPLKDTEAASLNESKIENAAPLQTCITESADPMLVNARSARDEPRLANPQIDSEEPKRPMPRKASELPI